MFSRQELLRWLYLGRITLVSGIFAAAVLVWAGAEPQQTLVATGLFIVGVGVTAASFWYTHSVGREPGQNFLYAQILFDVLIVTGVVHITGGGESDFAPLYILVISAGALVLPLRGGVLVGILAPLVYFADIAWGHAETLAAPVFLQIGLFTVVAVVTGYLGDRLRRAGIALGEVESELRHLRLNTGDILRTIPTGVVTVDEVGRLAYMNPAAEQLLGVPFRQWRGAPVLDLVEETIPQLGSTIRETVEDGRTTNRRKAMTRKGGRDFVLGVSTTRVEGTEDRDASVTAIFQDITDSERIEELNRRTERLEAVAELSASLAHEIKNPLASIRSAVEQITGSTLEPGDRESLERLVLTESDRLSRLLSEFIEFARVEIHSVEDVALVALVRDSIQVAREHPDAADGVRVVEDLPGEPVTVEGDGDLLHRAVFNLVLNAVQFAGAGGEVTVSLEPVAPDVLPSGIEMEGPVRLGVRDDGPGIAADDIPRIFDPFFTTRERGSGLGLAVVHRAVEAHQGAVFVDTGPGRGTEFTIYLPSTSPWSEGKARDRERTSPKVRP